MHIYKINLSYKRAYIYNYMEIRIIGTRARLFDYMDQHQ
jgi:hypothetical protein